MSRYFTVCFNCPDRKLGCHKSCEKYLAERKAYETAKDKYRKDRKIDMLLYDIDKKNKR